MFWHFLLFRLFLFALPFGFGLKLLLLRLMSFKGCPLLFTIRISKPSLHTTIFIKLTKIEIKTARTLNKRGKKKMWTS